mgnify:CR=1 FL=1
MDVEYEIKVICKDDKCVLFNGNNVPCINCINAEKVEIWCSLNKKVYNDNI